MHHDSIDMGLRIRRRRREAGLTQRRLSLKLDVTADYISKIERGEFQAMKFSFLFALAAVLNTRPHYILFGEKPMEATPRPILQQEGALV